MATQSSHPHSGEHDWHSRTYVDEWIASATQRASTRRPELAELARLLPLDDEQEPRVLDVGGGHGELTIAVLNAWPQAKVTLQDFSEPMLDRARERLATYGSRVDFVASDLSEAGWSEGCPGPFHAVVSAIAIHNVRDPETIRAICAEIFDLLVGGGAFVNLDYFFTQTASVDHQLRWLTEIGFDEVECIWNEERRALLRGLRH